VKCSEFLQELTNYLDGALDDSHQAELEDHLAWCPQLLLVCDTTKETIEIYRDSRTLRTARRPARGDFVCHHEQVPTTQEETQETSSFVSSLQPVSAKSSPAYANVSTTLW